MQMLVVLLFAFVVAIAVADDHDHGCDAKARLKVKSQWVKAYATGHEREDFAKAIWRGVFAQVPDAKSLFKGLSVDDLNSPEVVARMLRVLAVLDIVISILDASVTLEEERSLLEKQHDIINIPDNYFDAFKTALLQVLSAQLGRYWDQEAWDVCFDLIAYGVKGH